MSNYLMASDGFGEEEIRAVSDVMRSGQYTMGKLVKKFENSLADWLGVKNCIMVNSGSSANLLLVDSTLRRFATQTPLKTGDEVLVPALAWSTSVFPIAQLGLVPVFVDVHPQTLAIDLVKAQKALTKKTKAMFLIHVLGYANKMDSYVQFCQNFGLTLLEDCCESLGAFHMGRHVGTFGYGGTLSHFFSHHLTTIEGGSIITQDSELAEDLRSTRAHGWVRDRNDRKSIEKEFSHIDPRFLFILPGYNVRPTEIQAAIGLVQLKKLDEFMENRRKVTFKVSGWVEQFCPWLDLIGSEYISSKTIERRDRRHSWMFIPFQLKKESPIDLVKAKTILEESGVETRSIVAGDLTEHPAIKSIAHRVVGTLEVSRALRHSGFMIGCHSTCTDENLSTLEKGLKKLGEI